MNDQDHSSTDRLRPRVRDKGKVIGPKPPLRLGHVWSIRARLQLELRTRDLALFNLAIDSKLRGCDLVALRVDDVAPNGYALDRANVRQRKTGRPVRFELTEVTRQAVDDYLRLSGRKPGQCLFPGRRGPDQNLTTRQYARLVGEWVTSIGLDPLQLGLRRLVVSCLIVRFSGRARWLKAKPSILPASSATQRPSGSSCRETVWNDGGRGDTIGPKP